MTPSFLARLRERKLVQWALAYLAGAWLVLQVVDILGNQFAWPGALLRSITVLLAMGFFATLVIAWYHGEKGHQRVTGMEVLMLAGILVLAGAAVAWVGMGESATASASDRSAPRAGAAMTDTDTRSIAVLPFENLSTDPENAFFASGVHEEVLTQLSKIGTLKVISRSSVLQYAAAPRDLREIGEVLGVATVLEGSVQRAGGRVRITAQLIDARTDRQLWAERYDRDLQDIFAIQSEVALEIARQLNATLSRAERERIERRPTENLTAYALYLKGRQVAGTRSREGLQQALRHFEEAVRLDSTFAAAHAGVADAYGMLSIYHWVPRDEAVRRAEAAVARALALDPNSAEAHTSRASLLDRPGSREHAEQSYLRAIELRPSYALAHHWYGLHLLILGRSAEGLRAIQRASELDPLSPALGATLSLALSASGDREAAVTAARRTIEIVPAFWGGYAVLADVLVAQGRIAEAIPAAEKADELAAGYQLPIGTAGAIYARAGQVDKAREALARSGRTSPETGALTAQAMIHANLGQRDTAFALLHRETAWDRNHWLGLRTSALWDPLRADPRWPALLRHLGIDR